MSYVYEYVENNWDAFLTEMANGERAANPNKKLGW